MISVRRKEWATKLLSWIFEILEILKFFQHFFIFAKITKFQNFQKTGMYLLEEPLKNVCTKFQVIPFINVVFIAF